MEMASSADQTLQPSWLLGVLDTPLNACMDSNVVRADFGSGLIRNRAEKCCALKSSAPSGARQDNCADLLDLQTRRGSNHSAAHVGESNSRSNVFQIPSCFRLRAQPLKNSAGRVPQAADDTCNKIS